MISLHKNQFDLNTSGHFFRCANKEYLLVFIGLVSSALVNEVIHRILISHRTSKHDRENAPICNTKAVKYSSPVSDVCGHRSNCAAVRMRSLCVQICQNYFLTALNFIANEWNNNLGSLLIWTINFVLIIIVIILTLENKKEEIRDGQKIIWNKNFVHKL